MPDGSPVPALAPLLDTLERELDALFERRPPTALELLAAAGVDELLVCRPGATLTVAVVCSSGLALVYGPRSAEGAAMRRGALIAATMRLADRVGLDPSSPGVAEVAARIEKRRGLPARPRACERAWWSGCLETSAEQERLVDADLAARAA